jgi:Tfp pilus assembly protein PilP
MNELFTSDWFKVLASLVAGGGLATLLRAFGQNRTDRYNAVTAERSQLSTEQAEFRAAMAAQLARLDAQVAEQSRRNDALEIQGLEHVKQIAVLERDKDVQAHQIANLQRQNEGQGKQITEQHARIEALTEEKAQIIQRLQVAEAKADFLERENNQLRQENLRLRERLPTRVEVSDESLKEPHP